MASLTESEVRVQLRVDFDGGGLVRVRAYVQSFDTEGRKIRSATRDITSTLSTARITGATTLMNDVVAAYKTAWNIP